MIPSQLLKGTLEGCVLAVIRKKPTYGYEIAQQLAACGFGRVAEGTIYPLLLRLERNGAVQAQLRPSELGPNRKYYALTERGEEELAAFMASYAELTRAVDRLLAETRKEESP